MSEKEDRPASKEEFVNWFSDIDRNSVKTAGGKGANLGEMYNNKIPVPPGFVVTAQAYDYFIEKANLKEKIKDLLEKIDYSKTAQLDEVTTQIRKLIIDSKMPEEIREEIIEAYGNLDAGESNSLNEFLKKSSEGAFVAVRSSATAEDLEDASFAGQQDTYLNIKGNSDLIESIKKCFASLFTSRATYYRNKKGFKHQETSLAVIVQKMVDSDKSGVIFSTDPTYKDEKDDNIIIEAVYGLGEGIVSGKITPDKYVISKDLEIIDKKIANKKVALTRNSGGEKIEIKLTDERSNAQVLKASEWKKLAEMAINLEEHYKKPQDIEFAIENGEIYIVQTRAITTVKTRVEKSNKKIEGKEVLSGLAASPGIGAGKVKIIKDLSDLGKVNEGDVLVTEMTNPDMVVTMQKASAIVTDEGGLTAHAAIVSREMGIPCIVGTQKATTELKEGEMITVDGFNGKVYKGKHGESKKKEVHAVEAKTKTKLKVIVDLPSFAERASKSGIKEVGLTRMEGIIAESGKHPNYFLEKKKFEDYEDVIFKGINQIAKYFEKLWIRTSDVRSDEFSNLEGAPKEKEANPMLGMHGIRYGVKHPEMLKAELNALKRVSERGKEIGLLLPQVISVEEVKKVKEILNEIGFSKAKVGVMVETPAAVQIIKKLCDERIDFISFGTNDLTQYILAVDRGNEQVQHLYEETHPAILYQLEFVIRVCKRAGVETSICGQAGSKREMVKFLVERGIDSISVNADMAKDIADYIEELEGRDEEKEKNIEESVKEVEEATEDQKKDIVEEASKREDENFERKIEGKPEKIDKEAKEEEKRKMQNQEDNVNFSVPEETMPAKEMQEGQVTKSEEEQQENKDKDIESNEEQDSENNPIEEIGEHNIEKEKDELDIF